MWLVKVGQNEYCNKPAGINLVLVSMTVIVLITGAMMTNHACTHNNRIAAIEESLIQPANISFNDVAGNCMEYMGY